MIKIGNTEISKIYIGSTELSKVYLGSVEVYGTAPTPTGYTLPDVPYLCNYNAVDFDDTTQTFYRSETGQTFDYDLTRNLGSRTLALDGRKIYMNADWAFKVSFANTAANPFNMDANNTGLTIIYKTAPAAGQYDTNNCLVGNRDNSSNYNWMARAVSFHDSISAGGQEEMVFTATTSPATFVIRVNNGNAERKCIETNQVATTGVSFTRQSKGIAFFAGWSASLIEGFKGDFYWLYISREVLTDAQVQQVIDYNEHKGEKDFSKEYFTIKALENGTLSWAPTGTTEYSVNNGAWDTWTGSTSLSLGDKIRFRSTGNTTYNGKNISSNFNYRVEGNIMSLLYGDNFENQDTLSEQYVFSFLFTGPNAFQNNTRLQNAENLILPATTLSHWCYQGMFQNCTSLQSAPELPATSLEWYCYDSMFQNCTSLQSAPELPATDLYGKKYCYASMFNKCINLTTAPALPATTLGENCYTAMFAGCTSLTTAPVLSASTLANTCYQTMFSGCTSLTSAPNLPAISLQKDCYRGMFAGCTSLTTAPIISATSAGVSSCFTMFANCTSLTSVPDLSIAYMSSSSCTAMFSGCTALQTAPALPAATLGNSAYKSMFAGCSSLNYIKCLATDISATNCTLDWTYGVAATGTFVKSANMSDWTTGTSGIPDGWSVQDAT